MRVRLWLALLLLAGLQAASTPSVAATPTAATDSAPSASDLPPAPDQLGPLTPADPSVIVDPVARAAIDPATISPTAAGVPAESKVTRALQLTRTEIAPSTQTDTLSEPGTLSAQSTFQCVMEYGGDARPYYLPQQEIVFYGQTQCDTAMDSGNHSTQLDGFPIGGYQASGNPFNCASCTYGRSEGTYVKEKPSSHDLTYAVVLVAPVGYIWTPSPSAECSGYNTRTLDCRFRHSFMVFHLDYTLNPCNYFGYVYADFGRFGNPSAPGATGYGVMTASCNHPTTIYVQASVTDTDPPGGVPSISPDLCANCVRHATITAPGTYHPLLPVCFFGTQVGGAAGGDPTLVATSGSACAF